MNYRVLGRTGLKVSEVGFGTAPVGIPNYIEAWNPLSEETQNSVRDALALSLDMGYNYFDTATGYGKGRAEELLGRMLKDNHQRCYVATKTPPPSGGWSKITRDYVFDETEKSLKRLQVDYIDVLQAHGVVYSQDARKAVLEVVVPAYIKLKEEGKIRFIGLTNQTSIGVDEFILSDAFDVLQIRYNIIYQEPYDTFLNMAAERGIGITVNRPLTSGIFQTLMQTAYPEINDVLDLNELCLNFILSDSRVATAIVGMRRPSEVKANHRVSMEGKRFNLAEIHNRQVKPRADS